MLRKCNGTGGIRLGTRHCRTAAHPLAGFSPEVSAARAHADEKGSAESPSPSTPGPWHSVGRNVSWSGDNRKPSEASLTCFRDLVSFRSFPGILRFIADAFPAVFKVPGHSFVIGHGVKNFELNRIICLDLGYLTLDGDEIAWSVFGNAVRLTPWAHQLRKPAYSQSLNSPPSPSTPRRSSRPRSSRRGSKRRHMLFGAPHRLKLHVRQGTPEPLQRPEPEPLHPPVA